MRRTAESHFWAYAPDATTLANALKLTGSMEFCEKNYQKILEKLESEAVEDFRIDFEDGYGNRPDEEEDNTAQYTAEQLAEGMKHRTISPFIGIRIKPFSEDMKERSIRTLDIFISTLSEATGGELPDNFVVTLPKVTVPEQVSSLVELFEILEANTDLKAGSLKLEIMVETTQSIIGVNGTNALRVLVEAGKGRCIAAHFGTYDYTASCNITARYQTMDHPVCDFAHHMMKVALAGTGVWISDGATNVMPVGPNKGDDLSRTQKEENQQVVHEAWLLAYGHIRHSLRHGFYQGWDLHPGQLGIRYAAVYTFFLESYDEAAIRLKNFIEKSGQATLVGDVFDDAATGQGLLNFFLSAMNCGAISEEEVLATGLTLDEIRTRSFLKILEGRKN
ncbi:MAG: hypothetical protein JKX73_01870 [Flavobacteriales bacterium]|nr:hypothetical protein [Flavobacteriales bacterium]